jgi:hypothetical protein
VQALSRIAVFSLFAKLAQSNAWSAIEKSAGAPDRSSVSAVVKPNLGRIFYCRFALPGFGV